MAIIIEKLFFWCIPLGLFAWSISQPKTASITFIVLAFLLDAYLFFIDSLKPSPDPEIWELDEIEIIRKYHLHLKYPRGANIFSVSVVRLRTCRITG